MPVMIRDRENHFHALVVRNLDPRLYPDSAQVFYMRFDTVGNILDNRDITPRKCIVSEFDFDGVLDSEGNVHFVWGQCISRFCRTIYCKFSPSGELLDGPRYFRDDSQDFHFLKDSYSQIWLYSKDRNAHFDHIIIRRMSNEGQIAEDSLYFSNRPLSNRFIVVMAPTDVVYHFYIKARNRNVSIWCTAFDLDGNIIHDDVALSDTVHAGAAADPTGVRIAADSTIYMIHTLGSQFFVSGLSLDLEWLFQSRLDRTNLVTPSELAIDDDGFCHVVWEVDTRGEDEFPQRYHLAYQVINRRGEIVSYPEWISNNRVQTSVYNLIPKSLNCRYLTFTKFINREPHIYECFLKYYPADPSNAVPRQTDVPQGISLELFPNPSNGKFSLSFHLPRFLPACYASFRLDGGSWFQRTAQGIDRVDKRPILLYI